ncbi:trypsin-4-like [Phlebotomus argentipes]|uniref:trypsin-4-like n=1 Tax=Phlebotomus argentipes TaxID=94469 RepID=UPI002892EB81|nr:trypsin-4-like [Phlebotomus argentipes]
MDCINAQEILQKAVIFHFLMHTDRMISFVEIFILLLLVNLSKTTDKLPVLHSRIVGGDLAEIENVPYIVSLQVNKRHMCGGSIISKKYILTAAHCIFNGQLIKVQVIYGTDSIKDGGIMVNVEKSKFHPGYIMSTNENDIAVLKLSTNIQYSDKAKPIRLPEEDEWIDDGVLMETSGFGHLKWNFTETDGLLRTVEVPKVNQATCVRAYREKKKKITPKMFCAGYDIGGRDACQGDSGGPIVLDDVLVGVVSWGLGCASAKFPGVYTNVSVFRKWIQRETGL